MEIKQISKNPLFGKIATDKITGFKGTITGFAHYITGRDQYLITPKCGKDGKIPVAHWMDCNRLETEEPKAKIKIKTSRASGAMDQAPGY